MFGLIRIEHSPRTASASSTKRNVSPPSGVVGARQGVGKRSTCPETDKLAFQAEFLTSPGWSTDVFL
jgi:hypothetical protein